MASIIKNQILKHLSRFTKNLSANNIHLDTFKGEGTLKCLELDENVLTELLELPVWMKLTNAWCNSVAFQIQWTKLKSVPIHLTLDQVTIEIETCEELRSASAQGLSSYMQAPGKYSFIHKVIDGISIAVNTTEIIFRSPAFIASVIMLKILVESKTPEWKKDDLQKTRLKDTDRGQILIFKELQWQNVRIEAKSITEKDLPPLRLITDKASCRITIKKRLSDCFVVGSRLVLNLDTVLWVLTDSQLKAALHFLDSLSGLIQKSSEITRKKTAARKLEELPEYRAQLAQQARVDTASNTKSIFFSRHDVIETSYHFLSNNIDLHLSDDPDDHFSHPDLKNGGSLQINLVGFKVDFYPYHLAVGDRKHWPKYNEADSPHTQWLNSALNCFKSALLDIIESHKTPHLSPLGRTVDDPMGLRSGDINKGPVSSNSKIKAYLKDQFAKLMTTCIILRIADFNVHKVPTKKRSNFVAREFVKGDKDYHKFPAEMAILHAEFTYFYYPGDIAFPLPSPKFYVHANPVLVYFDVLTVLWLNAFLLNLHQSLLTTATANQESTAALIYFDVIVESIMPRLVFESSQETSGQRDRPRSLHFHVSRLSLTNCRSPDRGSSRADLAKCIHAYQLGSLYYGVDFPSSAADFHVITEKLMDHVECKDNVREAPQITTNSDSIEDILQVLKQDLLWTEAKDVWCVRLEPVWGDFYGVRAIGINRPVPFLDAVPVTLWAHSKSLLPQTSPVDNGPNEDKTADLHAIACVSSLVSVQINHYQLLFLMRLAEDFGELTTFLAVDTKKITNEAGSIVVGAILPQLEVTFVMQSQQPGKESTSGGDLESSVVPDSSSLVDDGTAVSGSTANVHWNSFHTNTQANGCLKDMDLKLAFAKDKVNSDFHQPSRIEEISNLVKEVTSSRDPSKPVLKKQGSSFFSTPVKSAADSPGAKKTLIGDNNISKKWTSLMDSFKQTPVDDMSDTASIRSDSDNSDSYIFLKATDKDGFADDQFNFGADCKVEVACEALDDDDDVTPLTTPPSERDSLASSYKRKDLISTATFKLGQVEFLQQSEGFHSAIKIQVTNVAVDECPSIPWDEFQSKFSTRSRDWIEIERQPGGQPCVKLRLNHEIKGNNIEKWTKSMAHQWASDYLVLRLVNINLTVSASTLAGISDVVEDEIVPQPLPLELDIENIKLHLIEERSLSNISSPEPVPVDLLVCRLRIRRGPDGVFCIEPFDAKNCNRILNSASTLSNSFNDESSAKVSEMKREIEQLRRRLAAMESLNEENHQLRKYQEETHTLRSFLNAAQQDCMTLLEEKRKLLELVENLQLSLHGTESSFSKR